MRPSRQARTLTTRSAALAVAAPQVIALRLVRLTLAAAAPDASDRREWQRMLIEKHVAFTRAWIAMGIAAVQAQQALALSCLRTSGWPVIAQASHATRWLGKGHDAALGVLARGLAPVQRMAVANAKRLTRPARRRPRR